MTRRPLLLFLLWLSGFSPQPARAMEYLCRFPSADQVTISGVATDQSGNTYVCGSVSKPGIFPDSVRIGATNTVEPGADAFVIKLAPDGMRVVTVLLGGEGPDAARKIAVDPSSNLIVLGYTASSSFPLRDPLQSSIGGTGDLFITKFDPTCTNVIFSTYVGGRGNESASALGVDRQGEIFFAGSTDSDDFPAEPDPFPWRSSGSFSFVAKLASDGSRLRFARHLGGSSFDSISALTVDADGNVCLTGTTFSSDFPTLNALQPTKILPNSPTAYVARIGPDGTLLFSTFLSGNSTDQGQAIAVNGLGEILVAGSTASEVFPVIGVEPPGPPTNGTYRLFLARFNAAGTALLSTNFYRFSRYDQFAAMAVAPDSRTVAGGTGQGSFGLPFFASIDESNIVSIVHGRTNCEPLASVEAIAFDAAGNLVAAGREQGTEYPAIDSYVARYAMKDWQTHSPAQVRILSPLEGAAISSRQPAYLEATVMAGTRAVSSVKFYDGRRLAGLATNAPFAMTWKNVSRGPHRLTAVAKIDGRAVTSCVVNVTAQVPPNDAFPGRALLKGENVEVTGDTTGATSEGDPSSMSTVWYSWKAPRDGLFEISVSKFQEMSYTSSYLDIFTGSRLKHLVAVGRAYRSSASIRARRDEVFRLRVSSYAPTDGRFRLRIRPMVPPANDNFGDATLMTGDSPSVLATLRDATTEAGENYGQFDPHNLGDPTVWFRWTAPRTGLFLVSATTGGDGSSVDCSIGNSISNRTAVGQRIFGETNGTALYAQEGVVYHLRLAGQITNNLTLSVAPYAPPPNDNFSDRFVIPYGFNTATGTLIGATSEPGEPEWYFPPKSVWWSWTPETNGVYRVTAAGILPVVIGSGGVASRPPSGSSEQVRVFQGDELTNLLVVPNLVGGGLPYGGEMTFQAFAGTNYQLAVDGSAARFTLQIIPVSTPANDNFDDAIELSGGNILKSGSTYAATSEPGEMVRDLAPGYSNIDSVWYRWIAPSNGFFVFAVEGARLVEVYEGATLDTLNLLASGGYRRAIQVTADVEYRVAVVGGRRFSLSIQPARRPANDDFADRQAVSGRNIQITGDAQDATGEPGEPLFFNYYRPLRSLWYSWTAPTNGSFRLASSSSSFDHLSIFTGDVLTNLTRVAEGDSFVGIQFDATTGATYQIAVDPPSSRMQFSLELSYLKPPRNDSFAGRLRLTGSDITLMATNIGSTKEAGEPLNGPAAAGHTVWWTWRAPRTGRVTFDVEDGDKVLGVYTGNGLTRLTPLTETNRNESIYNLPVQVGQDYQISVDAYQGEGPSWTYYGVFQLRVRYTSSPPNDQFANRRSFSDQASGDLEGGSLEAGEPGPNSFPLNSSAWWTWTAPSNGMCRFEVTSPSWDPNLDVFAGDQVEQLHRVLRQCPCSSSHVLAPVTAGTTYVLRVLGPATSTPYTLTATLLVAPAAIGAPAANSVIVIPGIIETSTNLVDWLPYTNAPANPGDFRFVPSTNEPYRFFRVR